MRIFYWIKINHKFLVELKERLFNTISTFDEILKLKSNKINLIYGADPW